MAFDLFKPDTRGQPDKPTDTNAPAGGQAPEETKEPLVPCPVHGDMVVQAVADAHVAAEAERVRLEEEAKAAEAKKIADEKAAKDAEAAQSVVDIQTAADQQKITDEQNKITAQQSIDAQAEIEQRKTIFGTAESQQSLADQQKQNDALTQLQDLWKSIATSNERNLLAQQPVIGSPIRPEMVNVNDPLELTLGDRKVKAESQAELADLLRFITDNSGYLPTGGTPLKGSGTQTVEDYKKSVLNEKALDTPERQAYQYWTMQQDRSSRYADDSTKLAEILTRENERRAAAGLPDVNPSDLRGIGRVYADRVARHTGTLPADEEIQAKVDEAYRNYATSVSQQLPEGWNLNPEKQQEFNLPNGWSIYHGDANTPAYYKDENGQSYTSQEVVGNPDLMKRFSDSITPQMIDSFKKEATNQPEVIEHLITQIGDTPEVHALLDKVYPQYAEHGVNTEYYKLIKKQDSQADTPAKAEQITTAPKLPDGQPDIIAQSQGMSMRPNEGGQTDPATGYPVTQPLTKWDEFLNLFVPWESGKETPEQFAQNKIRSFLDASTIPDRVKNLALTMGLSLTGGAGATALSAVNMLKTMERIQEAWDIVSTYPLRSETESYQVWEGPTVIANAGYMAITLKGVMSWANPVNWLPAGEAKATMTAGNGLVAEAASLMSKGYERTEIISMISKAAQKEGILPESILDDATRIFTERVGKILSPDTFKAPPKPIEIKPGEPFDPKVKYDVVDGVNVKIETPEYKSAGPGDPVDYVDPVTKKPYTRTDNLPEDINSPAVLDEANEAVKPPSAKKIAPAEGTTVPPEPAKPQGEAPAPAPKAAPAEVTQPAAMSRDEIKAQIKQQYPDATDEAIEAATSAREVKIAREGKNPALKSALDGVSEKWNNLKQTGIVADPKEQARKQLEFYESLVTLAKEAVIAGAKTVDDFAKITGMKVNAAVLNAWREATGKAKFIGYDNLPNSVKASISETKISVPRDFNPAEQLAVDDLQSWGKVWEEAWAKVTPENQAIMAAKKAKVESVMAKGGDVGEQHAMLKGLLQKAGFDPDQLPRLAESVDVLQGIARKATDVDVLRRHIVDEALGRLKLGVPPRPFEIEYMKAVFGEDVVSAFAAVEKNRVGDKIHSLLYNAMLTPVSQLKNFIGNTIATLLTPTEKMLAALVDIPLSGGGKIRPRSRFFGESVEDVVGMWQGIPDGLRSFWSVMKTGTTPEGTILKGEVQKGAFEGWWGLLEFNTRGLSAADQLAKTIRYNAEIRALAYRQTAMEKLTGNEFAQRFKVLSEFPTEDMVKAAMKDVKYRVFQKQTDLGNKIVAARNVVDIKGVQPLRLILPFVPTPINLVKYGLERTPLAALDTRMWMKVAKANPEASDQIARWVMGSLGAAALAVYVADGKITGDPPDNVAERDEYYRQGKQAYSIQVGDKWVSYKGIEPFNQLFLQVANVVEAVKANKDDADIVKIASKAVTSFGSNLISQNFMSGLSSVMDAMKEPERYGEKYLENTLSGLTPYSGTSRIAAQTIDPTIRAPQDVGQAIAAKIPGLSQTVPPKINVFGEEQTREYPGIWPVPFTTEKDDPVSKALLEADVTPGYVGNSINNIKLNEQQLQEYRTLAGRILKEKLDIAIKSSRATTGTVESRHKYLQSIVDQSRETARTQYLMRLKNQSE